MKVCYRAIAWISPRFKVFYLIFILTFHTLLILDVEKESKSDKQSDICFAQINICMSSSGGAGISIYNDVPYCYQTLSGGMKSLCTIDSSVQPCIDRLQLNESQLKQMFTMTPHQNIPYNNLILFLCCSCLLVAVINLCRNSVIMTWCRYRLRFLMSSRFIKLCDSILCIIFFGVLIASAQSFSVIFPEDCPSSKPICTSIKSCGGSIRSILEYDSFGMKNYYNITIGMSLCLLLDSVASISVYFYGRTSDSDETSYLEPESTRIPTTLYRQSHRTEFITKISKNWKYSHYVSDDVTPCPICLSPLHNMHRNPHVLSHPSNNIMINPDASSSIHHIPSSNSTDSSPRNVGSARSNPHLRFHSRPKIIPIISGDEYLNINETRSSRSIPSNSMVHPTDHCDEFNIVAQIPCGHAFHVSCITEWALQIPTYPTCPVCRKDIFNAEIVDV